MDIRPSLRSFMTLTAFTVSAFAQNDPSAFRANLLAQYGPPLNRETFRIPAGEMIVDYSASAHVCRIQLPPTAPEEGRNVISTNALDNFLLKLVPITMRGKELRRMWEAVGLPAVQMTEYENVTISETLQGDTRTGVTITFKHEPCADQPAR
jgi:hypothetical protein